MQKTDYPSIAHHGAVQGVTGSCHELEIDSTNSVLIDCGLFQGAETAPGGARFNRQEIDFPIDKIQALLVTHCHIDHVGRIPYLLAAGFSGSIYCSEPTAELLPLVLKDAVKIGFTKNQSLIKKFLQRLTNNIIPVPYGQWQKVPLNNSEHTQLSIRFQRAGHILGSAYIECEVQNGEQKTRCVFSGDLGGPFTPLLPSPESPDQADILVLESTYGDKNHDNQEHRKDQLKQIIEHCLKNRGVVLIPAFSIGRTQELLYELEEIIFRSKPKNGDSDVNWTDLEIIVDSPLANQFTEVYKKLRPYWDAEAKVKTHAGRHPLSFEQLTTIDSHQDHLNTIDYLQKSAKPCVVLAASGMCSGGRMVNYIKALIEDPRTDIVFVGYQAQGTPGRVIQRYGPTNGYVEYDHQRYTINAGVYTLSGYSAHAGQDALIQFVKGIRKKPAEIRIIHGDDDAKARLKQVLQPYVPTTRIVIPDQ